MNSLVNITPQRLLLALSLALTFGLSCCFAQDITALGGELSNSIPGHNGIQVAAPNVTDTGRRATQLLGFETFHRNFKKSEGLGPNFINDACGGCHIQNGKGPVRLRGARLKMNTMVIKVALEGSGENGAPINVPGVGEQLQDRTNSPRLKSRFRVRLRWRFISGKFPDGERYRLRQPRRLRFRIPGYSRKEIKSSLRMTPAIIGPGLLESIPEATILGWSDPDDTNNDGISGRPSYIPDKVNSGLTLGRFGLRAAQPTVEQQSAAAAFFDMGISNRLFDGGEDTPNLSDEGLEKLTVYQEIAGVPFARNQENERVVAGKVLFQQIGCDDCHKMTVTTESSSSPELDGQTIHPFTDLLLHDMGAGLADNRPEFSASSSEWRTLPLWGLGFIRTVSRVELRFMHDGRARSVQEAILWHGGEAQASRDAFKNLSKRERTSLLRFLDSL
ncbi:MAG: hypothetical protein KDD64_13570 [Bdellovibrionales bacterium]|nr:hypothetical protein [Bdellovibrionales bacterium]